MCESACVCVRVRREGGREGGVGGGWRMHSSGVAEIT